MRAEFIDPFMEALGWDVRNVQGRGEHEDMPDVNFRPIWGHRFSAKVGHSQRWRTGNSC